MQMLPNPVNTLPQPSAKLKTLLKAELSSPQYQGEDEDEATADALSAVLKNHGEDAFDPFNPADQILRQLAEE